MVISSNLSNDVTLFISMYFKHLSVVVLSFLLICMYALSLAEYKYLTQMKTLHTLASCYHEICHCFHKTPLHFFLFTHQLLSASLGFVFSVILTFHFQKQTKYTEDLLDLDKIVWFETPSKNDALINDLLKRIEKMNKVANGVQVKL